MSNMTPSEIADALDEVVATQEASRLAYKATELAAATIRELDASDTLLRQANAGCAVYIRELEAKLKIATEALEAISKKNGSHFAVNDDRVAAALRSGLASQAATAAQALARIKEV